MIKKLFLLIIFPVSIFSKDYIYQNGERIDDLINRLDWSICTLDGQECYEHVKIKNANNFGNFIEFDYIETSTNIYKHKSLSKPYMLIEVERESNARPVRRNRN